MKTDLKSFFEFHKAICEDDLVFVFGTGIFAKLRRHRQNEPYPCGSGKTFKRYCLGKGIYDGGEC